MKPILLPFSALLALALPSAGGDLVPDPTAPLTTTLAGSESGDWELTLGLYAWAAGLTGDVGAAGLVSDVDLSFSEILESLDMTAMGVIELRKGSWLAQLEGLYLRNSAQGESTLPGNRTITSSFISKTTRIQAMAGYRFLDDGCHRLDFMAGAVYYDISNELKLGGVANRRVKSREDWIDPIVALRYTRQLGEKWNFRIRGDVGGFGVNADLTWQAAALFGYQATSSTHVFAGWRYASVDYEKQSSGFVYDTVTSGPILGMAVSF